MPYLKDLAATLTAHRAQKVDVGIGGGDVTIKASPGLVSAIRAGSGLTGNVVLKNGAAGVWEISAGEGITFPAPIKCDTSIILSFPSVGSAWIAYS